MQYAIYYFQPGIVQFLVDEGADVDFMEPNLLARVEGSLTEPQV